MSYPSASFLPVCSAFLALGLALPACSSDPEQPSAPGGGASAGGSDAAGSTAISGTSSGGSTTGGTSGAAGSTAGGSTATGGTSGGAGGSAGGSGGSGGGPAGGSGGGGAPAGVLVSDDFEAASGTPDASKWSIFASAGGEAPLVTVTSDQAHSGTKSIKVTNTTGGTMLWTKVGLPPASGAIYYRAWARFVNGAASTTTWTNHVTFIEAGGLMSDGQVNQSDEVRLGGMNGKVNANLSNGDGLSPSPWSMPCALCADPPASDKWVCIEGLFDVTGQKTDAWIDGAQVVKAESPSDWHAGSTYPAALQRIGFGWEAYGGIPNTVYYDDIAVGSERIGCN